MNPPKTVETFGDRIMAREGQIGWLTWKIRTMARQAGCTADNVFKCDCEISTGKCEHAQQDELASDS